MTTTNKTTTNATKNTKVKIPMFTGLTAELTAIAGINEEGINVSCMNEEGNLYPYIYLILSDEKARNLSTIAQVGEKIKKLPTPSARNAEQKATATLLSAQKKQLSDRNDEIDVAIDSLKALNYAISPISAVWAFAKGTAEFGNNETVKGYAKIKESAKCIHTLLKRHSDELFAMIDGSGNAINEKCKGELYKDFKRELGILFTNLFGTSITAKQGDVAAIIFACINFKGGVRADSCAKEASLSICQPKTVLRKACEILVEKLRAREAKPDAETDIVMEVKQDKEHGKETAGGKIEPVKHAKDNEKPAPKQEKSAKTTTKVA